MITQTYQLDMTPGSVTPVVHVSQYDAGERELKFVLYAGTVKYSIPDNSTVTIRGSKSDGTIYEYECTVEENTATVAVTAQMTAVAGFHPAEIRIYSGTSVIGSANMTMAVEASPFKDYSVSATELPVIERAEQASYNAQIYENQASESASQAKAAQSSASSSASAAVSSAAAAKTSETNAASSASAAATSEKNAMSATPDGYSALAATFNALGLYVDSEGYTCQALDGEEQD